MSLGQRSSKNDNEEDLQGSDLGELNVGKCLYVWKREIAQFTVTEEPGFKLEHERNFDGRLASSRKLEDKGKSRIKENVSIRAKEREPPEVKKVRNAFPPCTLAQESCSPGPGSFRSSCLQPCYPARHRAGADLRAAVPSNHTCGKRSECSRSHWPIRHGGPGSTQSDLRNVRTVLPASPDLVGITKTVVRVTLGPTGWAIDGEGASWASFDAYTSCRAGIVSHAYVFFSDSLSGA